MKYAMFEGVIKIHENEIPNFEKILAIIPGFKNGRN
jgi:hypothetical protein